MTKLIVQGFMATTNPVPAYGGVALTPEAIYNLAASLNESHIPMTFNHDARYQASFKLLSAQVRQTDTDNIGVWVELEVEEDEWKKHPSLNGFSVTLVGDSFEPNPTNTKPQIRIFVEAEQFDQPSFNSAIEQLEKSFAVGGGRLYQFSWLPPARVVLDIAIATLQALPANLLASALYDGLKYLFRPKISNDQKQAVETVFEFKLRDGERTIEAQIKTGDIEAFKEALSTIKSLTPPYTKGNNFEFDQKERKWKKNQ